MAMLGQTAPPPPDGSPGSCARDGCFVAQRELGPRRQGAHRPATRRRPGRRDAPDASPSRHAAPQSRRHPRRRTRAGRDRASGGAGHRQAACRDPTAAPRRPSRR
eukprot:scaffold15285_cov102-Isochrysis_galbana.AAC.2